jgi:hypothetical protein
LFLTYCCWWWCIGSWWWCCTLVIMTERRPQNLAKCILFLTYCCCCCCVGSWCCCIGSWCWWCTYGIRRLPSHVAPRGITAHQNVQSISRERLLGDPATDLSRVTPDYRCVMTVNPVRQSETRLDRGAWDIIRLFLDPALG